MGFSQPVCPCDCAYPVLFIHGLVSNSDQWLVPYNSYFQGVWGARADVFHAAANATTSENIAGNDGIMGTADDDVRWVFPNENNVLAAGCVYAMNFDVSVAANGNMSAFPLVGGAPSLFDCDNNESAILKQGALVGKAIEAILAANPSKKKVILVGHSMGGLASREYLQRTVNNNANSAHRWWVNPALADGHKVAKLLTVGTPHLGSNTMGNISNLRVAQTTPKGGVVIPFARQSGETKEKDENAGGNDASLDNFLPDLASEAVRDLRYSYDNLNIFQNDYPGVYLFGGKETDIPAFPYSYWNNDVNCNGINDNSVQQGINQNGQSVGFNYQWNGTKDNPNMPLPTNVRYTYYVSNALSGGVLAGGDLVVDDQRQWLFQGGNGSGNAPTTGTPVPTDGTNHRLSDRVYIPYGPNHLGELADAENVVRGLDEGDYPAFAWDVNVGATYAGMAQIRATSVPEGPNTTDVDWYKFTLTAAGKVKLTFYKTAGLAGRVDLYTTTPSSYALMTVNGNLSATFASGSAANTAIMLTTPNNLAAGTYYFRIRHNAALSTSWRTPYKFTLTTGNVRLAGTEATTVLPETQDNPLWLFAVAPNPIKGEGKVSFQLAETQNVRLTLTNTLGQTVKVLYEGSIAGEELKQVSLEMEAIPSGLYFLQLLGEKVTKTERIVVSH